MTGLEKITNRILEEAGKQAEEIRTAAQKEADSVLQEAEDSIKKLKQEAGEKALAEKARKTARAESSAALRKRQILLEAKQEIISELIKEAHETLLNMEPERYFALMEKMADRFLLPRDGEICFSKRDRKRLPEGFEERLEKAAEKKGGSIRLSQQPVPIDGGFVLVYGGVEENCSFEALFAAGRDELTDKVSRLLFETSQDKGREKSMR